MIEKFLNAADVGALSTRAVAYLPDLLGAILLALLFWMLHKFVKKAASTVLSKTSIPVEAQNLLVRFIRYTVFFVGIIAVADQLGINVTSMVAGLGLAGLAFSFASQDTIANVISGIVIVIDRPFRQGDWISIGDLHAMVVEIKLRTTTLSTFDNETVVVPNKQMVQERMINYTLMPRIRVRIPVGIAYKENILRAREVLLKTVEGDDRILRDPASEVLVKSLGDSSVNLELRFWIEDSINKNPLTWEYTEKCKLALDAAGIEIPYPHLQLFLEQTEGLRQLSGKNSQ
ncbi:MAG: mechanosensitive ion channel family protein [SAR324 cluster bacterium]|nr:mechanosensitive ion channel family protein [SAR324 cluster bacterium]